MNNNLKRINIYSIYLGALILILPLIAFFINAFSFRWFYPQVIPKELSLQAWVRLKLIPKPGQRTFEGFIDLWASNPTVIKALVNSLTIGILVTIVSIIIALPAARVLGLLNFRFKKIIIFIMVSPTILPPIAFVLGLNIAKDFGISWDEGHHRDSGQRIVVYLLNFFGLENIKPIPPRLQNFDYLKRMYGPIFDTISAVIEEIFQINDDLITQFGLRIPYHSMYSMNLIPSIHFKYDINNQNQIRLLAQKQLLQQVQVIYIIVQMCTSLSNFDNENGIDLLVA